MVDYQHQGDALKEVLKIMYRPISIKGINGKFLTHHGDQLKFDADVSTESASQWVIMPQANGSVLVKSLANQNPLLNSEWILNTHIAGGFTL